MAGLFPLKTSCLGFLSAFFVFLLLLVFATMTKNRIGEIVLDTTGIDVVC